jgi:hypothetical protein
MTNVARFIREPPELKGTELKDEGHGLGMTRQSKTTEPGWYYMRFDACFNILDARSPEGTRSAL